MSGSGENENTGLVEQRDEVQERLQGLLQELMEEKPAKYAVAAVENGNGSFRWTGAAGQAQPDGTPMAPDTPFWMASVTKLYIAAAILKLHEQGRLSLEQAMVDYLPENLAAGLHQMQGVDYTPRITVRNLLEHSSGLPDYLEVHLPGEKSLFQRVMEEGDRSWTMAEKLQIVREVNSPLFPPQPRDARPRRIRYSDTGFQLLIAIIEHLTGQTLAKAFRELIYQPLGLNATYHPGTAPTRPAADAATIWNGDEPLHLPLGMQSFHDLNAAAGNMIAFMRALVTGQVFDDPATFQLMTGPWNRFPFSLNLTPVAPGWPIEYGMGMMRVRIPRLFTPLRPVPEVIGHTGVCGAWLYYCPPLDLYLAGSGRGQLVDGGFPFRLVPRILSIMTSGR